MNESHHFISPQHDASTEDDIIDLSQILKTLWLQKIKIIAFILVALVLGGYYAYMVAVPQYRATSVVLLEASGSEIIDLGAVLPSLGGDSDAINTEIEVLKSRRLMRQVVDVAGLINDPEFNSSLRPVSLKTKIRRMITQKAVVETPHDAQMVGAVNAMINRMSVRNIPNTTVLQITIKTEGAQKSAALANHVAEQYIVHQMDVKFEATKAASKWLGSRVANLKLELEEAEANLAAFSTNSEVLSPESVQALERQIKELRVRTRTSSATLSSMDLELANLESLKDATPEEIVRKSGLAVLETLLRVSGPGPEFNVGFNNLIEQKTLQRDRQDLKVISLEKSVSNLEDEILVQNNEIVQLQQLSRETEANRLLYEYFLGRLKETSAQEGIQQPDGRIISYAVVPNGPSEPRKSLILAMSIILGTMLGCGFALLIEARKDTFRSGTELEQYLQQPVLGQIPLLPTNNRRQGLEYLAEKPTSVAAEAIRNLRTSVLLSGKNGTPKVIMSTSSLPGEGKTTISFSLAQNLIGLGKKVLLVEGDIRRLVFSQYLNVKGTKGLMSVLSNDIALEDAVIRDPTLGADVLVSEASTQNAADILSSQGFVDFLTKAREQYDFIIIDTPPVLIVPDARIVAQHCDAVLFTVKWDSTQKSQVKEAVHMFRSVGVEINGAILNQIDPKGVKRYGYGDSYGAYSAYGSKYYTN